MEATKSKRKKYIWASDKPDNLFYQATPIKEGFRTTYLNSFKKPTGEISEFY